MGKRIARDSLAPESLDGNILVWVDEGGTGAGHGDKVEVDGALVEALQDQLTFRRVYSGGLGGGGFFGS